MNDDKIMQRFDKQDAMLEQLVDMFAESNEMLHGIRGDMAVKRNS